MSERAVLLTVVVRDERPMRYLQEPLQFRTVRVLLTPEQQRALTLKHDDEAISFCFFEPVHFEPTEAQP